MTRENGITPKPETMPNSLLKVFQLRSVLLSRHSPRIMFKEIPKIERERDNEKMSTTDSFKNVYGK